MGGLTFFVFLVEVVTGVLLMFYYRPTVEYAYFDIQGLRAHVTLGLLPPPTGAWLASGWVRGAVSGLGVLNLVTAARDAGAWWRTMRANGRQGS